LGREVLQEMGRLVLDYLILKDKGWVLGYLIPKDIC